MTSVKGYWTPQNVEPMLRKEVPFSAEYVEMTVGFGLVLVNWVFLLHKRDYSPTEHVRVF